MDKRGAKPDQSMHQHVTNCAQFAEYLKFYALPAIDAVNTIVKICTCTMLLMKTPKLLITMMIGPIYNT